jgi:putative transposase
MTKEEREAQKRSDELIDQMLAKSGLSAEAVMGKSGLVAQLTKRVVERALAGELTHHLGYEKGGERPEENCRNGTSSKRILTEDGPVEIAVPRDRAGTFEPLLVAKGQRRFEGFDEKIIAMYARGMSVREIQGFLLDQYKVEVSPDFISTVTDGVWEEVSGWQSRPLEVLYPIVFFDALRVKIRDEGVVKNKCVYLALGITADGNKDVLGIWIEQTEGARFWLGVMNELKTRGVEDILIAVVDGLKGFPEAIKAVFERTCVQTCIVHLTRFSLAYCSWQDRRKVAGKLQEIYRSINAKEAEERLGEFEQSELGKKYKLIGPSWRRHWEEVIPFFNYPPEVRKMIYTTNAIESLNMQVRKVIKNRGHFPSDDAALKLIYLALRNVAKDWKVAAPYWQAAKNQFAIVFGERFFAAGLAQQQKQQKP